MRTINRFAWQTAILVAAVATVATVATLSSSVSNGRAAATFSGTIAHDGVTAHSFTVLREARVAVKLTGLAPTVGTKVGFGIGVPTAAGNCVLTKSEDTAYLNAAFDGTLQEGTYCVSVYDSGGITTSEPIDYTLTVAQE